MRKNYDTAQCTAKPQAPTPVFPVEFPLTMGCLNLDYLVTSTKVTSPSQCVKKENTMDNMEQRQRCQMSNRIYEVTSEKDRELCLAFGIRDDDPPKTAEDFIQRVKDGNYVLRNKDDLWGESFYDRIRWRHPDKVADKDGYQLASKRLAKAVDDLGDKVNFLPIAESYKAFEEFKATDFRNAS